MRVIGIVVLVLAIVLVVLFLLQKTGYWLGVHLMSAIYAAKVSLAYGRKLSEDAHYEQEFRRFIDEKYTDNDFIAALDSIVASFTTIWIVGITIIPFSIALAVVAQQIRLFAPESVIIYIMAVVALVLEATAITLNVLVIIREVRRIIKTYRGVVFKEFANADAAGEKRKTEMATLTM